MCLKCSEPTLPSYWLPPEWVKDILICGSLYLYERHDFDSESYTMTLFKLLWKWSSRLSCLRQLSLIAKELHFMIWKMKALWCTLIPFGLWINFQVAIELYVYCICLSLSLSGFIFTSDSWKCWFLCWLVKNEKLFLMRTAVVEHQICNLIMVGWWGSL